MNTPYHWGLIRTRSQDQTWLFLGKDQCGIGKTLVWHFIQYTLIGRPLVHLWSCSCDLFCLSAFEVQICTIITPYCWCRLLIIRFPVVMIWTHKKSSDSFKKSSTHFRWHLINLDLWFIGDFQTIKLFSKKYSTCNEVFLRFPVLTGWASTACWIEKGKNCLHIKHCVFQWVIKPNLNKKKMENFPLWKISWPDYCDFLVHAKARPEETWILASCWWCQFTEFSSAIMIAMIRNLCSFR